ncbi:LysR family transcriptional regulator, partial [Rhizobium ruizarguesonis]
APPSMFSRHLSSGAIRQPFPSTISLGSYWLTLLQLRPPTAAMLAFSYWITSQMSSASQ